MFVFAVNQPTLDRNQWMIFNYEWQRNKYSTCLSFWGEGGGRGLVGVGRWEIKTKFGSLTGDV